MTIDNRIGFAPRVQIYLTEDEKELSRRLDNPPDGLEEEVNEMVGIANEILSNQGAF